MLTVNVLLVVSLLMVVVLAVTFKPLRSELTRWRQARRVSNALRTGILSMGDAQVRVPSNFAWR